MSGKHKSGYELLKAKYAKLEAENKELHDRVARQSSHISQLVAEKTVLEREARDCELKAKTYWLHMGWFRRWLWELHHLPEFNANEHWHEKGGNV